MTDAFIKVLNMSITATYVAFIVLLVRLLLKKAPKVFSYSLWSVVLLRLISPFNFSSSLSLLKLFKKTSDYVPQNIGLMESPTINTNIDTIDRVVNNSLPAATPYASVNPMQILMGLLTAIWILGIVLLIIYIIYSYIKVYNKIQFATLVIENIYETDQIISPFVLGFIKPKIYLPKGLQNNELEYIISHEKTHIRRYDYLIKPISFLALTLHWFNPFMWMSYYLMIKDMEMSCDESVLKNCDRDLRGNYSSSLLNLSIKQSRLLLPLAFGESNIKSRIKNILNYKKPRFWTILIALAIVIVISIGLITNPIENPAESKAKTFLKLYYTVENTDIADIMFNQPSLDNIARSDIESNNQGFMEVKGLDEALKAKFGDFMTEDALDRATANRFILDGEITAREYGSRLTPEYVNLWDEKTSDNGDITYKYSVPAVVKFKDDSEELVNLYGTLVMKKVDGKWKVGKFDPNRGELTNALQFGKSYLFITNHSNAAIRRVEVHTKGNSTGIMNDNTNMEKNQRFDFEMSNMEMDFTVELLNNDMEVLYERSFSGDFSEGKDVYLYIEEDDQWNLMINRGNSKGNEFLNGWVMVNDSVYEYTGYEIPVKIDESAILGKINSIVGEYELPSKNGQANFDIKGAKYAQYEDDIVVLIDGQWILFKNQINMISGFSVTNYEFLMSDLNDEEIYRVFRTIRKYIIVDENYEANMDSIIEKSFKECGIDNSLLIDAAISNLKITVSYPK